MPDGSKYLVDKAAPGKATGVQRLEDCVKRVSAFKDKPCDIIIIGDSITHLWLDQKRGSLSIWNENYAPHHALNFGVGGDSVQNVLWRLDNLDIKGLRPKVGILMIGTNNRKNTPEETAEGIKAVIAKTRETFPGIKIILMSILPSRRASATSEEDAIAINNRMMAANTIIQGYADNQSVYWLDLVPLMPPIMTSKPDGTLDTNYTGLGEDHLHPNGMGFHIWADAMAPLLTKLLN